MQLATSLLLLALISTIALSHPASAETPASSITTRQATVDFHTWLTVWGHGPYCFWWCNRNDTSDGDKSAKKGGSATSSSTDNISLPLSTIQKKSDIVPPNPVPKDIVLFHVFDWNAVIQFREPIVDRLLDVFKSCQATWKGFPRSNGRVRNSNYSGYQNKRAPFSFATTATEQPSLPSSITGPGITPPANQSLVLAPAITVVDRPSTTTSSSRGTTFEAKLTAYPLGKPTPSPSGGQRLDVLAVLWGLAFGAGVLLV
jgi:hypothetical protein